jgi:enoyl-CoA hydratase/carnithine racemase
MENGIHVTQSDGVARVTLVNPSHRNAMTWDMWGQLPDELEKLAADSGVAVIALQGKGLHFCSGADISEFGQRRNSLEQSLQYQLKVDRANRVLAGIGKPTVALIRGCCYGGGVGLAIHADLRYASAEASFAIPAAKLGVSYEYMSIEKLVDLIGPAWTAELFYVGAPFSAAQAAQRGLVNEVFAEASFDEAVRSILHRIAANAPLTQKSIKAGIALARDRRLSEGDLAEVRRLFEACFSSQDYKEGRKAFLEKRKPDFKGS